MAGKIDAIRVGDVDYDIDLKSSSTVSVTSLSTIGDVAVGSNLAVTGSVTSGNINPTTNKGASLGTSSYYWNNIYGTTIYENGSKLSDKYVTSSGVTSVATSGTGLSGGTITSTGTITLDSSQAGNAAANKVILRNAAGSIQTEKLAVSSGTTTKATMQYNSTEDCIEFIFA